MQATTLRDALRHAACAAGTGRPRRPQQLRHPLGVLQLTAQGGAHWTDAPDPTGPEPIAVDAGGTQAQWTTPRLRLPTVRSLRGGSTVFIGHAEVTDRVMGLKVYTTLERVGVTVRPGRRATRRAASRRGVQYRVIDHPSVTVPQDAETRQVIGTVLAAWYPELMAQLDACAAEGGWGPGLAELLLQCADALPAGSGAPALLGALDPEWTRHLPERRSRLAGELRGMLCWTPGLWPQVRGHATRVTRRTDKTGLFRVMHQHVGWRGPSAHDRTLRAGGPRFRQMRDDASVALRELYGLRAAVRTEPTRP